MSEKIRIFYLNPTSWDYNEECEEIGDKDTIAHLKWLGMDIIRTEKIN